MLVLSRRPDEKVVFPNLGIKVHVLRSTRNTVRLGIEAPREVAIFRDEVAPAADEEMPLREWEPEERKTTEQWSELKHSLNNRLNTAMLGLHLLQRELQAGDLARTEEAVSLIMRELESLDQQINGKSDRLDESSIA